MSGLFFIWMVIQNVRFKRTFVVGTSFKGSLAGIVLKVTVKAVFNNYRSFGYQFDAAKLQKGIIVTNYIFNKF